ncbi:MAG TPA: DNA repair protein RecN [Ilumatobacteraceae bacterium]|nr:DNA repair protein RecN [Ilumatobacteraceae bacterium]
MLHELHIESMGVIGRLDLVLTSGLTAFTGETGAGKTMLVEAINLLVGGRADPTVVRPGVEEARIEGRFVVDDDEYIVARVIPTDGQSRAYVNGRLATATTLAELGARTIDLHGQHAHQSLLTTAAQRDALDRFCSTDLQPLRAARARLVEIDAALAALGGDQRSRAREVDLLRFQLDELSQAAITEADEDALLSAEEDTLADASAHREAGQLAVDALSGTDETGEGANADRAAVDALAAALRAINGRAPFEEFDSRLAALAAELTEVARELRGFTEALEEDPERLSEIRERRQLLRDMRRKYGDSLADVIAFHDEARDRLTELESYDQRVAALEEDRQAAVAAERAAAASVAKVRRAGASKLGTAVRDVVRSLAMPHAEVDVVVGDEPPGDDVSFLIAANPGLPMLPLSRVASGGELARTMLALRLVLTEAPETLVFDEVDAGIGGTAATAVAAALARLGRRHQVMVVTHLAQVAALADTQIVVTKSVGARSGDATTVARAKPVDGDERIDEVARMLSGEQAGAAARRHAADLLDERLHLP